MSLFLNTLHRADVSLSEKYFQIMGDYIIWFLFNTSSNEDDLSSCVPGKIITVGCMIIGLAFNIYILIQILNIVSITRATRTKYYEVMNQLEAYMQKKQFPAFLQRRLKFFYMKKFRRAYFCEDEILGILSGESFNEIKYINFFILIFTEPLKREILINNTDQLFVERVKLFRDLSSSTISSIAACCKKEQFLPNDLVNSIVMERH